MTNALLLILASLDGSLVSIRGLQTLTIVDEKPQIQWWVGKSRGIGAVVGQNIWKFIPGRLLMRVSDSQTHHIKLPHLVFSSMQIGLNVMPTDL
jgi:hypothetical protein